MNSICCVGCHLPAWLLQPFALQQCKASNQRGLVTRWILNTHVQALHIHSVPKSVDCSKTSCSDVLVVDNSAIMVASWQCSNCGHWETRNTSYQEPGYSYPDAVEPQATAGEAEGTTDWQISTTAVDDARCEPIIAVIGRTGTGKTSFIKSLAGDSASLLAVGSNLKSCQ